MEIFKSQTESCPRGILTTAFIDTFCCELTAAKAIEKGNFHWVSSCFFEIFSTNPQQITEGICHEHTQLATSFLSPIAQSVFTYIFFCGSGRAIFPRWVTTVYVTVSGLHHNIVWLLLDLLLAKEQAGEREDQNPEYRCVQWQQQSKQGRRKSC